MRYKQLDRLSKDFRRMHVKCILAFRRSLLLYHSEVCLCSNSSKHLLDMNVK